MSKRLFFWSLLLATAAVLIFCAPQNKPHLPPPTNKGLSQHTRPSSLPLNQAQAILMLADRYTPLQNWHSNDDDLFQDGLRPPVMPIVPPKENQPGPAVHKTRTEITYFGHLVQGGILFAFVHFDGDDYVLRSGDTLAKRYRVLAITPQNVFLRYRNSHRTVSLSLGEES